MNNPVVSVYGFGRFGRLWAEILAQDFRVQVYSRSGIDPTNLVENIVICDEQELFSCDALFFCVAISAFQEVLQRVAPYCRSETVYFDTCSVKVRPARWMKRYLPPESAIIATHPMFGPDSYHRIKHKLPLVMCNVTASPAHFQDWQNYFCQREFTVVSMSSDEHDRTVAYSQGITHYVGRLLAELHLHPTRIDTLGFTKILEVITQTCNDSWQLFLDLQNYNPYANEMRHDLDEAIAKINRILAEKMVLPEAEINE